MQIGPIPITSAMLREHTRTKENSNITPYTVNEDNVVYRSVGPSPLIFNVKLIVPPYLYKQIEGLSEWKQIYPIVLNELYVDQLSVQGWGFIANVQLDEIINPVSHIQISFDVYIVEHDENCFLKMDYTNGIESNSTIDYTFDDVVNETVFTDHFGEFDTTPDIGVWETPVATSSFTGSISSNGTKLVLSGHSATSNNGQTIFTVTQNPANIPFTMDFNLEWAGVYASYPDQLFIGLYADKPVDGGDVWANDYVQANLYVTKTSAKIYYKKRYRNTTSNLVTPDTLSSSETNPKIRFVVDKNGKLTIYSDTDRNGEWTKVWGTKNPGWDINDNLYIVIGFSSWSTNTKSRYVDDIDLYNMIKTTPRNIVSFPPGCSRYQSMNSFGRNSEDGSFYACVNPNIDLIFQTTYANWDKGSVKVYNNYNL
jgi:hypothetical protein